MRLFCVQPYDYRATPTGVLLQEIQAHLLRQHTATTTATTHCNNTLQQHTASTLCNDTLQHTATTHCNTRQHTATLGHTLHQHAATRCCNILQYSHTITKQISGRWVFLFTTYRPLRSPLPATIFTPWVHIYTYIHVYIYTYIHGCVCTYAYL